MTLEYLEEFHKKIDKGLLLWVSTVMTDDSLEEIQKKLQLKVGEN